MNIIINKKSVLLLIFFVSTLLLFTTCKKYKYKYPESTYKWGDPAKAENCPFYGKLTAYNVNGIDSLELLNHYFVRSRFPTATIKDCEFVFTLNTAYDIAFSALVVNVSSEGGAIGHTSYSFNDDKKSLRVFWNRNDYDKNLFISKDINWEIIRLSKDDKPFKLKTTLSNGNIYEIQIR